MAMPKWDKSEQEMEDAGVTPVTRSWPPRCRTWFYAHGGVGPEDRPGSEEGKSKRSRTKVTSRNRRCSKGGVHAQQRERRAYARPGKSEHPGRTRGKGVIPWYEGFSEWNDDYRTRARKKMEEE